MKQKPREWKPKVGDEVFVKLPMSAKIQRIYKDGSMQLETEDGTLWAFYSKEELQKAEPKKKNKSKI